MRYTFKNNTIILISLICFSILMISCNTTKFLSEGESFARENRILLKSTEKIKKKSLLKEELSLLYKQNQNNNWIGIWAYYNNRDAGDTLWYHNFVNRFFAEEPSIFNEYLVKFTASEMEDFLKNKRGFYHAKVRYLLYKDGDHGTGVDYIIDCGRRYTINSIEFYSPDITINTLLQDKKQNSYLRKGDPVSSLEYELEKNRITNLLQNLGYAQFFPNFIELVGDSSKFMVDLKINIFNPSDTATHKIYKTSNVRVYSDYHPNQEFGILHTDTINGIIFHRELPEYLVNPELIASMIELQKGELTSKRSRQESYNRLSLLNPYKFIAIKLKVTPLLKDHIDYDILLIPKIKKWSIDNGVQLYYTTLSQSNKLFGLRLNFSLENQNLFGGAERFLMTFNADTDIGIIQVSPQEFNLQNNYSLFFPKPRKIHKYSLIRPIISLASKTEYKKFRNYAYTKLSVGGNFMSLANTISILSANASLGYQYSPSKNSNLHINQISIDYYYPTIINDTLFSDNFYLNSLSKRVITGFLFKDIAYSYSSNPLFSRFSWQFNGGFELSGHEVFLTNKLYNIIAAKRDTWVLDKSNDLKFAKYAKTYLEFVGSYKSGGSSWLVSRFYLGFGLPYEDNSTLPYTKQFYVGGPESIRAWEKRGLGPGGFYDSKQNPNEIAYQKGDIKLEANIEYRFDLPWYFEGAAFVDAGNVWTFKDDENLENENFSPSFYNEIAVAGGLGLRLNFNFLLLRLDLGYKLRTPYLDPEKNQHWQFNNTSIFRDGYLTFGMDYPF